MDFNYKNKQFNRIKNQKKQEKPVNKTKKQKIHRTLININRVISINNIKFSFDFYYQFSVNIC